MSRHYYLFLLIFLIGAQLLTSCTNYTIGQQPVDSIAPAPVENVKVENTPGGAIITYTLPGDQDLLYVKGTYTLKDNVVAETKSSLYNDTLKIKGFGDEDPKEVTIVAVDRSGNASAPVVVTIHPLTPPVLSVAETLKMKATAGGVITTWENPLQAELTIHLQKVNSNQEWETQETFYSAAKVGQGTLFGQPSYPQNYRCFIQDRWGNRSPYLIDELTPGYEIEFDKGLFKDAHMNRDSPYFGGWELDKIWDGKYGNNAYAGLSTVTDGKWPQTVTFDLGVHGRVSRIKMFQRGVEYLYTEGNVKRFEIYGATEDNYVENLNQWIKLGSFTSIKPSGLPFGSSNEDDRTLALVTGEDHLFPEELEDGSPAPKVRYLCIRCLETWSGGTNFQIGEIFVYGNSIDKL